MKLLSSLALFLSFSALAQPGFADGTYFRPERVGSKPRPTMDKIADTVNVKDFGAKCDWNGTTGTDDHVALQNALNAATSASPNTTLNAINLVISGPCYIGTTGLTVPSSKALFIRGEGSGSIVYAGGPGTVGFRVGDGNGIAQWIDIQGLTFDCINVTGGAALLSGATCVMLDSISQSTFSRVYIYGPLATGPNAAYGLRVTSTGAAWYNQRTTFSDIHIQGDFDIGVEISPGSGIGALEHTISNVTVYHSTNSSTLVNLRGTIGFRIGSGPTTSTFTNTLLYTTAGYTDIGYSINGKATRAFWIQPEANGVAVLFRTDIPTFSEVSANEMTLASPGNNGTLVIGQNGFPWKPATQYQTSTVVPLGVGAWRTNARGNLYSVNAGRLARAIDARTVTATVVGNGTITAGASFAIGYSVGRAADATNFPPGLYTAIPPTNATTITYLNPANGFVGVSAQNAQISDGLIGTGIYRLSPGTSASIGNPCTSANTLGPVHTVNKVGGCLNGINGVLDGTAPTACCWQYYKDQIVGGPFNGVLRYNTIRRLGETSCNILTGDNGLSPADNGELGSTNALSGAGPTGDCTTYNPSESGLNVRYGAGWATEQVVNVGVKCATCGPSGAPSPAQAVSVWDWSKSAVARPTFSLINHDWSVGVFAGDFTKLTVNPGITGTVQLGAPAQMFSVLRATLKTTWNTAPVGSMLMCTDCNPDATCTAGTGALAKKLTAAAGAWACN